MKDNMFNSEEVNGLMRALILKDIKLLKAQVSRLKEDADKYDIDIKSELFDEDSE